MSGPSELDQAYYPRHADPKCKHDRGWIITNGYRCADCGAPKPKPSARGAS